MTSSQIRQKYLDFFAKNGHKIVPSSSLVPENDPSTLFTSAGMQPMIPYLLGETHPEGKRIVDSQKCFRAQDVDEVGDNRHDTFFEMLGNWSFGDYFKTEQLGWFYEFLAKEINLDPNRIYVSVFEGNADVPKDEETAQIWRDLSIPDDHIHFYGVDKNWWSRSGPPDQMPEGEIGGPDSEVFYEFPDVPHNPDFGEKCHPNCDCGRFLEIGNSVFIQYIKRNGKVEELPQKNVDFGGGLERLTTVSNNDPDMFKTDLFWPLIERICEETGAEYGTDEKVTASLRIIADHIKAATFLIKDGVLPSNKLQGYVLRRLLRRAAVKIETLKHGSMELLPKLVDPVIDIYQGIEYFQTGDWDPIRQVVAEEIAKFEKTIYKGLREIDKFFGKFEIQSDYLPKVENAAEIAFNLYQTYGLPQDIFIEALKEKYGFVYHNNPKSDFYKEFEKLRDQHSKLSQTTSAGMFKGGLADHSEETTKLHTATHMLQAALKQVLGAEVGQRGSNITAERLRFDFNFPQKLTDEQVTQVEEIINQKIQEDLPVHFDIEEREQAISEGATTNVGEKYPDKVKVYKIGDFSKELCGGPHVDHTGTLHDFKIDKQESLGTGLRRIYAHVE